MDPRHEVGRGLTDFERLHLDVLSSEHAQSFASGEQRGQVAASAAALQGLGLPPQSQAARVPNPIAAEVSHIPAVETAAVMTETDSGRRMVLVPLEAIQSGQVKVPGLVSISQPTFQSVQTTQIGGMSFAGLPLQPQPSQPVMSTGFSSFDVPGPQQAPMMNNAVMFRPSFPMAPGQASMAGLGVQRPSVVPTAQIGLPVADIQARPGMASGPMNTIQIKPEAPQAVMTAPGSAAVTMGMAVQPFLPDERSRRASDSSTITTAELGNQDSQNDEDADHKAKRNRGSYRCSKCGEPKRGHICPYRFKAKRRLDEPGPDVVDSGCQAELDPSMTVRALKVRANAKLLCATCPPGCCG